MESNFSSICSLVNQYCILSNRMSHSQFVHHIGVRIGQVCNDNLCLAYGFPNILNNSGIRCEVVSAMADESACLYRRSYYALIDSSQLCVKRHKHKSKLWIEPKVNLAKDRIYPNKHGLSLKSFQLGTNKFYCDDIKICFALVVRAFK